MNGQYKLIIIISLISLVVSQNTVLDCFTNLECLDSGCCKNNKCVESDECRADISNMYIAIGVVGLFFVIISIVYFLLSVKVIRKNVREIQARINAEKDS